MFTFDKIKRVIALLVILLSAISSQAVEFNPDEVLTVCTENGAILFDSETDKKETFGGNYGCLGSTPAGRWCLLQIGDPGKLVMKISQKSKVNNNQGLDVDFIAFGPFEGGSKEEVLNNIQTDPHAFDLAPKQKKDTCFCNYSSSAVETFTIDNAKRGEWYLVLITNFYARNHKPEESEGTITFERIDDQSTATTNCSIIFDATSTGPYCTDEDVELKITSSIPKGAKIEWFYSNNKPIPNSKDQKSIILKNKSNVNLAGRYIAKMNVGTIEYTDTVDVVVNSVNESGINLVDVTTDSKKYKEGEVFVKYSNVYGLPLYFTLKSDTDPKFFQRVYKKEEGTDEKNFKFSNLEPGTYRLEVNVVDRGCKQVVDDIKISNEESPVIESVDIKEGKYQFKLIDIDNFESVELFEYDGGNYRRIADIKSGNVYEIDANKVNNITFVARGVYSDETKSNYSAKYTMKFPTDIYVKQDGKGNGSDWEHAMGNHVFANVLQHLKDYRTYTFHVAEGRYIPIYNEKKEVASKGLLYVINNNVRIIGGYSSSEMDENAPSNPLKYHTVFTTDPSGDNTIPSGSYRIQDPSKDDVGSSKGIFLTKGVSELSIDGVEFIGCNAINGNSKLTLNLSRCKFELTVRAVQTVNNLIIDNCIFNKVDVGSSPTTIIAAVDGDFVMKNSTISNNYGVYGYVLASDYQNHHVKSFTLENNTFFGNKDAKVSLQYYRSLIYLPSYAKSTIFNNTIINNEAGYDGLITGNSSELEFVGNLIVANTGVNSINGAIGKIISYDEEDGKIVVANNLYDFACEESDIKTKTEYLVNFIDGTYTNGSFKANLVNNGGFTPTVALTALSDGHGTDIRFSKSSTIVNTDQRGVARKTKTCVGAYEFLEEPQNYYVKEKGTGDGSSWDEAMSPESFANVLPVAPKGSSFYVAEGRYLPIFNASRVVSAKGLQYIIKRDVKVIGGYSPNELDENASNDPTQYHTIFTADPSGDDTYKSGSNSVGDPSKDDIGTGNIVVISGADNVSFDGVEFEGCGSLKGDYKVNLSLSRCSFKKTQRAVEGVKNLTISECLFTQMSIGTGPSTIIAGVDGYFDMRNSTVTDITAANGSVLGADFQDHSVTGMTLANNTFVGNTYVKIAGSYSLIRLPQAPSKIYNNTIINNPAAYAPNSYIKLIDGRSSDLEFVGNLIVANEGITKLGDIINVNSIDVYGNNLYDIEGTSDDIKSTKTEYLGNFLDGQYVDGVFKANLNKNEGFTPTIALISTNDGNETDVRFPKSATIVDSDQRGIERKNKTCVGAFESLLLDDYYVKVVANGSGSNWKDAMSFEAFSEFLPKAPNGVTFHFAEGEYKIEKIPYFMEINSSVKFVGGYPETNEVDVSKVHSNPSLYSSSYTSTVDKPCFQFSTSNLDLEFHNLEFSNIWMNSSSNPNSLVVDSCKFYNSVPFMNCGGNNLEIRNSYFKGSIDSKFMHSGKDIINFAGSEKGVAIVENSTFKSDIVRKFVTFEKMLEVKFVNNTIYNGETHICSQKIELFNNTLIGNSTEAVVFLTQTPETTEIDLVGNIMYGTCSTYFGVDTDKNNIVSSESSNSNLYVKDFTSILEGKNVDGVFVPTLANHGGFVPTIALKNDELLDGTPIRFTRLSDVTKDANGVTRISNTCPGAVELVLEKTSIKTVNVTVNGITCIKGSGSVSMRWSNYSNASDKSVVKFAVKSETGKVYYGPEQDTKTNFGSFVINGLEKGTYTIEVYVKKDGSFVKAANPELLYTYSPIISNSLPNNKFVIKSFVDPNIPAPVLESKYNAYPNFCDPADGGRDYAISKWTDDYYNVRVYSTNLTKEDNSDAPFEEVASEKLIYDHLTPSEVYEASSGKKAYFSIRKLSAGFYRFVVTDDCQTWVNRVFEVKDDVKPTPRIETLVTPYTCSGVKDGAITIRVHDYYSSQSWIDDKSVVPTYWGDGYVDFTLPEQGKGDKHTFKLIDVCEKEQNLDLDMYELSKKNGLFQLTNVTAGAGRNKNDEPNGAACQVDDHRIKMKVQGGTAPYTFEIYDSKKKKVASKTVEPESGATSYVYTSGLLVPDNYVVYVSDATGCKIGDGTHANFKAKYDLSLSAYEVKCTSDPDEEYSSHIMVNGGSTGYVALYKDENDENPYIGSLMPVGKAYVDVPGTYAYGITSFRDGCFAYSPISETPLSQSFMENLYKIEIDKPYVKKDQTCYGVNNGSFTIYPKATFENTVYGPFSFVCTLENAVTGEKVQVKEGIFNLEEPITFEDLAPGKYSAYFSYQLGECVKGKGSNFLKSAEIVGIEKPVLEEDDDEELIIRCEGATVKSTVHVKNYDKKLYTWKLTKDKVDITSTVKVDVPTEEVSAFVLKELTVGSYLFSLVDECGKSYEHSFKVGKNIKEPKEFKATYSSGITCEGKSDARLDISVTNWNNGDKGVVTNSKTNEVEKDVNEYYKGGTTSFFKYNLSGGKYTLTVNDICKKDPLVYELDLDELSETSKFGISLAEAASDAECNEDNRKLSATVSGLETQAPYSFVLYQKDGEEEKVIDDKQKEVTDRTYTSAKLGYGAYKLTAVNKDGCEASIERSFSPSHTLSGTRVLCGTNTHVELNYDGVVEGVSVKVGGKWADVKFAEGANKSIFDYNGVVTDVRVKESGCATDAALSDAKLADDLFAGVNASAVAVNQTCYGVDNGSIKVTYSGYKGNMQVVAYAFDAAGKKKGTYDANKKSLINLPPGTYEVKLGLEINGCEVADQSLSVDTGLKIEGLEKPEFLEDNFAVEPNHCEGLGKGRMHLEMKGWKGGIYKWTLQRAGQPEKGLEEYTHCGAKLENGATAFDLWSLPEGMNVFTMWDACGYKYTKTANIKAAYYAPLTLDTINSKAYTCADRTDGSLTFVASPWDVEDKAVLKKGSTEINNVKPVVKDGKAYFALANQGAGVYSISTTDLCARTDDKSIDFTAFSEKNGLLTVTAEIDKDAAVCEIGKRVIKVTANGGTSPYVYAVTKTDGTAVETSEELEAKTYSSQLVSAGKYKVSVTDNTECTAVFDGDLTVANETLNVKLDKFASTDQTCYGKNNAVVSVAYTGFNTELAKLRLVVTEKTEAEKKKSYEVYAETNAGTLELNILPTGSYDVKVELVGLNGCEMNNGVLLEKEVELKSIEKPEFLEDNFAVEPNHCEGLGKGRMHLEMKGWKDGIYKWTLQRAGQLEKGLEEYTHCGAKLENGATAFDLWSLPEGMNVFTMWDACGFKYTKTANIKAAYYAPLTLDTINSKAYTCADRTDGSLTFVASPWDVEDKAVLKKGSVVIDNVKPVVKDGKAYFALANQGAGVYSISTTDLCARTDDKSIDFTAFSEKNGMLVVDVDFDAEAAKCDVDKRIFNVSAQGGTAPYVYAITKTDGTAVETSDALEVTSYNSQLLVDGQYKVTVTDKTECTAVYGGDLSIDPAHTMKALMREVVCDDHKNVTIVAAVDGSNILGSNYIATDAAGNEYKPLSSLLYRQLQLLGISYYKIPADVTLNGISAKVDEDCRVYTDLAELPLDKSALEKAVVTVDKLIDERCYNANNGELQLNYSGPETSYTVAMRLKRVADGDDESEEIETDVQKGTDLKFKFEDLAPGEYELYLVHKVGDCDAGIEPRKIQNVTIKPMLHKFERIAGDTTIQSTCYSAMNAMASIKVHGWCPEYCTWELFKDGVSLGHDTTAAPVNGDTAVWCGSNLTAGAYEIKWTNYCNTSVSKPFVIDPLKEPKITLLSSSYTDLKCEYDKAYIDFHYEGGSPENKRILFIDNGDWEYTTEPLKAENTYRYYGHTIGAGLNGHKKAEETSYELTDEDKGLNEGTYTIIYQDANGNCPKDDRSIENIKVNIPHVKLNLAKQDVLCYSENYGVINLVPTRKSKDLTINYKFMDEFKDSEVNRTEGQNFGEIIFNNPATQKVVFQNRDAFLSKVFSDVESISLEAKSMPQQQLYKLMQDSIAKRGTNLKNPLSSFCKDGGYEYAVSDWIGFNMLPVDMYYVTVNDIYGCHYTDSIEIKGPKDGLRVDTAYYPLGDDPECNAESRRIKFTCAGGYYPYFYSVADTTESIDDNSTAGSGMSSIDYVSGATIEKYEKDGKQYIDYTSKMLKPGRYEVSVMDTMGCIAKWKHIIEVKAKHTLDATPYVDVCDPGNDNKLDIHGESAKSYSLIIGHKTHCIYYPYCTVDDDNNGLLTTDGKSKHVHVCSGTTNSECPHFYNCVEHKEGLNASSITYKIKESGKWVAKNGFGLSGIPGGTIGVLATYNDGCTAFDEYTFNSSGLPASIMSAGTDSVKCNGAREGAVSFSLAGGHDSYKDLKLNGVSLVGENLQMFTRTKTKVNGKDSYNTEEQQIAVSELLNNKSLFKTLKMYYDGDALFEEAKAILKAEGNDNPAFTEISEVVSELKAKYGNTSYSFRLEDMYGSVNWENPEKNKKHILTVVDEQDCEASMEFDIYQPTKLHLTTGASVVCPDGSGRIYASSTSGGVPPYEYRMNEVAPADHAAVFIPATGRKPKTYEGEELYDEAAYKEYYVDEYHKGDHIPAGRDEKHYMWVKDANGCEMKSDNYATLSKTWHWERAVQEQYISTWHDYGDVLVVEDVTDYDKVDDNATYDSMKVIIVMEDKEMNEKFEGIMLPKENYVYGVRDCAFGETGKCGTKDTPFGTFTTSWGISPKAQEAYNEYIAKEENPSLKPIHTYFDKLVSDEASRRMTFVKFQTPEGKTVNINDMIGNKDDYHLNFMVRVVAYVGGCDIVTEHNPLVLNLKGPDPYADEHYKNIIKVDAYPNPVSISGECTLKVELTDNTEDFDYIVFSIDGKKIKHGHVNAGSYVHTGSLQHPDDVPVEKEDGNTYYTYLVQLKDITETSIVKVVTETSSDAVKILAK